jgi:hypothetical protein
MSSIFDREANEVVFLSMYAYQGDGNKKDEEKKKKKKTEYHL